MKNPSAYLSDPAPTDQVPEGFSEEHRIHAALLRYLNQYITLTPEEVDLVLAHAQVVFFPKDRVILEEGQVSHEAYFIMSGLIRQYYVVDGEERTTFFYAEEESVALYTDVLNPGPSPHYLACVEDSIVIRCADGTGLDTFSEFPKFEPVARAIGEKNLRTAQTVLTNFMVSSPEERYLHLLKTRPDLVQRVPQYQLASYLGVQPESLSRIRKRIATKG